MDSNDFNVPQKVRSLVQQILPQEIIVLFDWVQIHNKKKQKIETQLIVISKFRLFTFEESKKSIKKKPNRNGSFLTLKQLISFDKRHIKFGFQDFELDCYCDRADTIVEKTMKNYLRITQGIPHERFIDFSCIPSGRLSFFQIDDSQAGGFISTYEAWCNYLNIQPNIDLINYIEEKILKNEDERKKKTLDLHKLDRAGEILSDEGTSQALFQALSNNLHF
ncbi:hypothetical protein M0811_04151 [Anaeramoeba ignava]|uniref:Uncharacterized protein n=1 Tax=Anaeramoeba ignava TaxID=1746090 RepID=A0A9Q0LYN1_ANAIG|nr:hypothetical protein M0811_04151 [Anaeramoeba ignava]